MSIQVFFPSLLTLFGRLSSICVLKNSALYLLYYLLYFHGRVFVCFSCPFVRISQIIADAFPWNCADGWESGEGRFD